MQGIEVPVISIAQFLGEHLLETLPEENKIIIILWFRCFRYSAL